MTMTTKYYTLRFTRNGTTEHQPLNSYSRLVPLSGPHIRNGANSQIFIDPNDNMHVLKQFNEPYTDTRKLELIHKLHIRSDVSNSFTSRYTWPKFLVLDEANLQNMSAGKKYSYQGYFMQRVSNAVPIDDFFGKGSLCTRMSVAYQLVKSLIELHKNNMAMGDISANNILISQDNAFMNVVLIDSDSFVLQTPSDELFRTLWYTDPYYCRQPNGTFTLSDYQKNDAFGFAVLCFQLFLGINPFDVINNSFTHQNPGLIQSRKKYSELLKLREFPLFCNNKYNYDGHQLDRLQQDFFKLPLRIQNAFIKSFTDKNLEVTPLSEWMNHLETMIMRICTSHNYLPKREENENRSDTRTAQILSFPKSSG